MTCNDLRKASWKLMFKSTLNWNELIFVVTSYKGIIFMFYSSVLSHFEPHFSNSICGTLISLKNHNFNIKLIFRHYSSWFSQLDIWICSPVSFLFTIQQWNACSFSSHLSPFTFATSNSDQLITKKATSKFDSGTI